MAIDLNAAAEQGGSNSVIPPLSKVLVKLSIQIPKTGREGSVQGLTRSQNSGLEYLSTILEVVAGTYSGTKIYHNFNVQGAGTEGQRKAVDISIRSIRALVESARGISPKDASPRASSARMLNNWTDIHDMTFPVVVDCEQSLPNREGRVYINNKLKSVVTSDDTDYPGLMAGAEIISQQPIPEVKEKAQASSPVPTWATPPQQQAAAPAPVFSAPAWAAAPAQPAPTMGHNPPPTWMTPGTQATHPDVPF